MKGLVFRSSWGVFSFIFRAFIRSWGCRWRHSPCDIWHKVATGICGHLKYLKCLQGIQSLTGRLPLRGRGEKGWMFSRGVHLRFLTGELDGVPVLLDNAVPVLRYSDVLGFHRRPRFLLSDGRERFWSQTFNGTLRVQNKTQLGLLHSNYP